MEEQKEAKASPAELKKVEEFVNKITKLQEEYGIELFSQVQIRPMPKKDESSKWFRLFKGKRGKEGGIPGDGRSL